MILFSEFQKFPKSTQTKIIDMGFAANIPSELDRIKKSLEEKKEFSEFADTLLENITLKCSRLWGRYYEVTGLVYISSKDLGIDIMVDDD